MTDAISQPLMFQFPLCIKRILEAIVQHLPVGKLRIALAQGSIAITEQKLLIVTSVDPPLG